MWKMRWKLVDDREGKNCSGVRTLGLGCLVNEKSNRKVNGTGDAHRAFMGRNAADVSPSWLRMKDLDAQFRVFFSHTPLM